MLAQFNQTNLNFNSRILLAKKWDIVTSIQFLNSKKKSFDKNSTPSTAWARTELKLSTKQKSKSAKRHRSPSLRDSDDDPSATKVIAIHHSGETSTFSIPCEYYSDFVINYNKRLWGFSQDLSSSTTSKRNRHEPMDLSCEVPKQALNMSRSHQLAQPANQINMNLLKRATCFRYCRPANYSRHSYFRSLLLLVRFGPSRTAENLLVINSITF